MKITEILFELKLQKNRWALDISNDAKVEVSDDLISLVQSAYAGTEQGSFVNNVSNLLPSDWAVLDFDEDPDVDSAVFYRGPRPNEDWTGYKIQGLGHDGSRASKDHALHKILTMLSQRGWWIESSGALRNILAKRNARVVNDQGTLQSLFPDSNLSMISNGTYTRTLPSGNQITETVFGNPVIEEWSTPLTENDVEHREALKQTGFWGKQGAGCLFLALDTGKLCIAHRSSQVEQPNTWGTWGGAIDSSESPENAVKREAREESGYNGKLKLVPLYVFSHPSGFRYYNYIALIPTEFKPTLDWETQGYKWCTLDDLPSPLHSGLVTLLKDPASVAMIKHYSN